MIRYIGKKLVYFIMTWPFFRTGEEKVKEEKVVRSFLGKWWKEMKRDMKVMFFSKKRYDDDDE